MFCEDGMIGILISHAGEEGLTFEEVGALAGGVLRADGLAVETLCREALYRCSMDKYQRWDAQRLVAMKCVYKGVMGKMG